MSFLVGICDGSRMVAFLLCHVEDVEVWPRLTVQDSSALLLFMLFMRLLEYYMIVEE